MQYGGQMPGPPIQLCDYCHQKQKLPYVLFFHDKVWLINVCERLGPITIAARRAAPEPRLLEVILLYARYGRVSVLRSQSFILF